MSILYIPRPSQKTKPLILFQLSNFITCFGLRPGHMISDVQLTKKNSITKRLAFHKTHFLQKHHFHFLQKKGLASVLTKIEKFKNCKKLVAFLWISFLVQHCKIDCKICSSIFGTTKPTRLYVRYWWTLLPHISCNYQMYFSNIFLW